MQNICINKLSQKKVCIAFFGGHDKVQDRKLFFNKHPKICCSTPGRMLTHLSNGLFRRMPIQRIIFCDSGLYSNNV